jgi:rare lipoprotein A
VFRNACVAAAVAALTAGCASTEEETGRVSVPSTAGIYKIGNPYQIGDTWYYPREQPDYDETGVASWYGPTFYGRRTANGETFDAEALTAAHRTLPMPVNVRVTNLENGKSLILRVNDRGPYAKGRIIDVSERAAELLGYRAQGTARVRVTYVGRADINGAPPVETSPEIASAVPAAPTEKVDTAGLNIVPGAPVAPPVQMGVLPSPMPASPEPAALDTTLQPTGQVTKVPVPAVTHLYVQAGAFSSYENAARVEARLSSAGKIDISSIDRNGQRLYRVRMGPFDDVARADDALSKLNGLGNGDAKIVVDQ